MSELNEAFRELNRFCAAHDCIWRITTRALDGTFRVLIDYNHGSYEHRGDDLPVVIREAIAGVRRLVRT